MPTNALLKRNKSNHRWFSLCF